MKISGVDFPIELLKALRDGELVVFAGAGVSVGPPACLPMFSGLAEEIARGTGEVRGKDEPEDRFLGRLQDKGVHVHDIAAQVLSKRGDEPPGPTALHSNILRLYSKPDLLRVVTTNFDLLFEQAASDVFETDPKLYSAPVLPLGGDFEGIVHVHGDINHPGNAVLTDADFGRAYLTEGWARRFLATLFGSFPVLFIGYSHSDVVMNYLARALTVSETERYVLAPSDEDETTLRDWQLRGIQRIEYPKSPDDNYRGLYEGVSGLAEFVRRDSNDWKSRITTIAEQPPSDNEEQIDLIDYALLDAELTRHFISAKTPPEWIGWLAKRDDIDGLFTTDTNYSLSERDVHLSHWLAQTFAREHSDPLFQLIGQRGMCLHPDFWWKLARVIGEDTDVPMDPESLSRWVSIFRSTPPLLSDEDIFGWLEWGQLGERCMEVGLTNCCIDIFELMAGGRLEIDQPFVFLDGEYHKPIIRAEFKSVCDYATINELWVRALKPKLDNVAEPLLARIVELLEKRHRILHARQAANRVHDPLDFPRSSVTPIDVFIDAARDCLEHLLEHRAELAAFWCERVIRADPLFLRKLAVHALHVRNDMSETDKIKWLLSCHDILDLPTETETLQVLRATYPHATPQQREVVIADVLAFRWPDEDDKEGEDKAAYEHFHWLYRLHEIDPECTLTKQELDKVWSNYPYYRPREEPGTVTVKEDDWTGNEREDDWIGNESPWNVEELLARPAGEWTHELLSFQPSDLLGPNREGLQIAVEEAAKQDLDWSLQLADTLAVAGNWQTDLWPPLLRSWCGEYGQIQSGRVLGYLKSSALHVQHGRLVVEALIAVLSNDSVPNASALLPEANQIAKDLGQHRNQVNLAPTVDDWLFRAINSVAGKLAQYWVVSLDVWRKQREPAPERMSWEYRSVFTEIIADVTQAGTLGKAVLGCFSAHLLEADEPWATRNLLPLFGQADNMPAYQAVWDGFLSGQKTLHLAELLKDSFFEAISRLNTHLAGGRSREKFVRDFTLMLEYVFSDPTEILNDWIPKFFANAGDEDRVRFGQNLSSRIKRMEDAQQRTLWDGWLGRYLANRLQGVPAPLLPDEVGAILGWLPHFKSLFPDAVELAGKLPPQQLDHSDTLYRINQGTLWETYPEAVAALVAFLDRCTLAPYVWHFEGKELIDKLLEADLTDDSKRSLLEISVRRGLRLEKGTS